MRALLDDVSRSLAVSLAGAGLDELETPVPLVDVEIAGATSGAGERNVTLAASPIVRTSRRTSWRSSPGVRSQPAPMA